MWVQRKQSERGRYGGGGRIESTTKWDTNDEVVLKWQQQHRNVSPARGLKHM